VRFPAPAQVAYRLLLWALSPVLLAWLWWRHRQSDAANGHIGQRRGYIHPAPGSIHGLWIHAASVGEVQAAEPLIRALLAQWPAASLTVSTQSLTGAQQLRQHWGAQLQHLFLPIDTPGATARFLDRLQPRLLVLIERELWPELLLQCRQRSIPVALVNARLSERSAQSYQRFHALMRPVWSQLALVACADNPSRERLAGLGVPAHRLMETGNLKFDLPIGTALPPSLDWLASRSAVLVAGSTHEGEESALLAAWPAFAQQHPRCTLVLVPRHPERFDAVARQIASAGFPVRRRSQGDRLGPDDSVYLADTMGELRTWYAHATACFIGGSLAPIGGHNALEALACAKPVLFGPHTHNFQSLYEAIQAQGIGALVANASEALHQLSRWLSDPQALAQLGHSASAFVQSQQGSSARTIEALMPLWSPLVPRQLAPVQAAELAHQSIWFNPTWVPAATPEVFEPTPEAETLATGSGRGQAHRVRLQGREAVLRHYRRGGAMARISKDRFAPQATALGVGLDAVQQGQHGRLDAVQRLGRVAFKAQHQHGRGVAGADQAKAIGPVHAQAVDGVDLRGAAKCLGARACSSAVRRCGSPSAQATFSSGVLWLVGRR
jgi:3-deoxy-D-manno-octulosonic-acid transferase